MRLGYGMVLALLLGAIAASTRAATPGVSAADSHSLALHADGTVRSWGDDSHGALGVGRPLVLSTPRVVEALAGVRAIAARGDFTAVLKNDGTVWSWGANDRGQLGDGSTTPRSTPVQAAGLGDVEQIAVGRFHAVARKRDGTVWAWGATGLDADRVVPRQVAGISGAIDVAAGSYNTFVRKSDGTVWAWGGDGNGELGDGTPSDYLGRNQPVLVRDSEGFAQIAPGAFHTVARKSDGSAWAWGANDSGQVGDGTRTERWTPVRVGGIGFGNVVEVAAGYYHSLARRSDGSLWAWGAADGLYNDSDSYGNRLTPVRQVDVPNVVQIALAWHAMAVSADGSVWAWGANNAGQLGDGTTDYRRAPAQVPGVRDVIAVAVGSAHSVALKRDGTVMTWGDNALGQLGNATLSFRATPSVVAGLANVKAIAGGGYFSLALTEDGSVYAWGDNVSNQFHDSSVGKSTPQRLEALANVVAISAAWYHSVALLADGTVRAWGGNSQGELGAGNTEATSAVLPVAGLSGVTKVAAGGFHTLALRGDGTVWAWGGNDYGQLGDGTTVNRNTPVQVLGLADVVDIAAGGSHSLARLRDGTVMAWGKNYHGQLGDGTNTDRLLAVRARTPAGVTALAAGAFSTVALVGGNLWVWGWNDGGFGCAGCNGSNVPVQVPGIGGIAAISAKSNHVLALRGDGSIYAVGRGTLGHLGDGTLLDRESPVVVVRVGGGGSLASNDWFLDLAPAIPSEIPADRVPVFLVVASGVANALVADIRYRPQDVGSTASTFVFAMAPASSVRGALKSGDARFAWKAVDASGKAGEVQCALAQLNAQGDLVAVSAASLQAYVTGVLTAQGQSVNVLNGVTPAVAGATFFVGYGPDGNAMLTNGTARGVVTVPASVSCKPQAPQAGWWFNPAEGGRGFSIEARGNRLFMAAFHYEADGRATWNFAGGATSLDGSLFTSGFVAASGGQTLTGPYRLPSLATVGPITLAFSDATHGTMIWPGGTTPIERQAFVPNGLAALPQSNQPESGWWWNPDESGRGFFIEWQAGYVDIAGYMYDAAGRPTWYLTVVPTPDPLRITGNWWTYANGQAMGQPYRPATRTSDNAGSLAVEFTSATTGTLTLPDGRRIAIQRQAF